MTSTSGLIGNLGQANYSAAKLGIVGLSKSIALDMAKYNVRSNCIAPFAWSRMIGSIPTETDDQKARVEKLKSHGDREDRAARRFTSLATLRRTSPGRSSRCAPTRSSSCRQNRPAALGAPRRRLDAGDASPRTRMPALRAHFYPLDRSQDVFSWDPTDEVFFAFIWNPPVAFSLPDLPQITASSFPSPPAAPGDTLARLVGDELGRGARRRGDRRGPAGLGRRDRHRRGGEERARRPHACCTRSPSHVLERGAARAPALRPAQGLRARIARTADTWQVLARPSRRAGVEREGADRACQDAAR